jgi:tetratricopeptide (TPR) repeat protein
MIIEQHYDEEVLAEFLAEPADAVTRDKHLASCDLCLTTLDSLRGSAAILRESAVWDRSPISTTPRPDTLAFLRGVQKSMADEDATAAVWIKQLLAGSRETWAPRLAEHPEWRTGGMVRALLAGVENAINTVPTDGVEFSRLAVLISEALPDSVTVRHLQGLANYHLGYAFWYTGATAQALDSLDHANARLESLSSADLDRARVQLMRAMIFETFERRDEALRLANAAAATFREYGDMDRHAAARSAEAITLQAAQRWREALAIHVEIAASVDVSDRWRVSAVNNMAICYGDLGEFEHAAECLTRAINGYERLGMMTFRSKTRWTLAQVFAQQGKHAQALPLFKELRGEFEELGMANDVALLSLDMCESLLALGLSRDIGEVCRAAIAYFAGAGLSQTEPALRGLAYLQEVAAAGRATAEAIRSVRAFVLSPEDGPRLLFAELPR